MVFLYMHSHLQMSQARIQSRRATAFKVERGIGMVGSGVSVCHFIFALQILFWIKSKPKRDVFSNYEMDVVKITPEQLVSLKWVTDGRNLAIAILQNLVEKNCTICLINSLSAFLQMWGKQLLISHIWQFLFCYSSNIFCVWIKYDFLI